MSHHGAAQSGPVVHRAPDGSADDEYLPVEGSSYEHTDANVGAIVKFGLWLVITALVVHVGVGLMYKMLSARATVTTEQPYPLAGTMSEKLPPEPRLQEQPARELVDFRAVEDKKLHGYGWVNKSTGQVRIPIEEAMRLTVERGLASRAPEPGQATPAMLASDSSAGRVMERRRQ